MKNPLPTAVWLILLFALVLRLGFVAYAGLQAGRRRDRLRPPRALDRPGDGYADVGIAWPRVGVPPARLHLPPRRRLRDHRRQGQARARPRDPGRIANALLGTLVVALIGLIAAQLWGRRVALVAMALRRVYIPLIIVGGSIMSETAVRALMLGSLAAAIAAPALVAPLALGAARRTARRPDRAHARERARPARAARVRGLGRAAALVVARARPPAALVVVALLA